MAFKKGIETSAYLVYIALLTLIIIQLSWAGIISNLSPVYISFYKGLAMIGLAFSILYLLLDLVKDEPRELAIGSFFDETPLKPLSLATPIVRFLPHLVFIFIIIFSSLSGLQLVEIPQLAVEGQPLAISTAETIWFQGIIPGFTESLVIFIFAQLAILFVWLVLSWLRGSPLGAGFRTVIAIVVILLIALGSGFLFPGAASGHAVTYGDNDPSYIGAVGFFFIEQMIFDQTGIFFPLAHILHNGLLIFNSVFALSIGTAIIALGFLWHRRVMRLYPILYSRMMRRKWRLK